MQEDLTSGSKSGVKSTPGYFINGAKYEGWNSLGDLTAAIEAALSK